MSVEKAICEYLKEEGIRQKWLAEKIGVSEPVLSMILGKGREMRMSEYLKICEVINVEPGYFLKTKNC